LQQRVSNGQELRNSPATARCPHRTADVVVEQVIATRRRFPHFGPKKVRAWLCRERPGEDWPAVSTIGDILKREGLVTPGLGAGAGSPWASSVCL
jgi:hypothetical protein